MVFGHQVMTKTQSVHHSSLYSYCGPSRIRRFTVHVDWFDSLKLIRIRYPSIEKIHWKMKDYRYTANARFCRAQCSCTPQLIRFHFSCRIFLYHLLEKVGHGPTTNLFRSCQTQSGLPARAKRPRLMRQIRIWVNFKNNSVSRSAKLPDNIWLFSNLVYHQIRWQPQNICDLASAKIENVKSAYLARFRLASITLALVGRVEMNEARPIPQPKFDWKNCKLGFET